MFSSLLEIAGVISGLIYVILAVRTNSWCWVFGAVTSLIYTVLFWQSDIYLDALLSVFYLGMSISGWIQWQKVKHQHHDKASNTQESFTVRRLTLKQQLALLSTIAGLTLAATFFLSLTDSPRPLVDSFTTVSSLFATWLLVKQYLDNWIYWIVINAVNIAHYVDRDLLLTGSVLYFAYLIAAIIGALYWYKLSRQTAEVAV